MANSMELKSIGLGEISDIPFRGIVPMMDGAGITDDDGMRGNVTIDKGSRSNQDIVSNGNLSDYGSINTDTHATADGGDTLARTAAFCTDSYSLMKVAIVAQNGASIHGDIVGVAHIETFPNPSATRNFNPMLP